MAFMSNQRARSVAAVRGVNTSGEDVFMCRKGAERESGGRIVPKRAFEA
jgi:hypothetical protein